MGNACVLCKSQTRRDKIIWKPIPSLATKRKGFFISQHGTFLKQYACDESKASTMGRSLRRVMDLPESPYVLKPIDYGYAGGVFYTVSPLMSTDFYYIVEKAPEWKVLDTHLTNIWRGMCFMHAHHIAHMDIKLENIVLDDKNHAMLIDFDFSVPFDDYKHRGTPNYAPPYALAKTWSSHKAQRHDLYAFGRMILMIMRVYCKDIILYNVTMLWEQGVRERCSLLPCHLGQYETWYNVALQCCSESAPVDVSEYHVS